MRSEWDSRKAEINVHVHGIRFAEAVTVWEDAFSLTREDPDALGEQRFVTRMLSAWRANKRQRKAYEKGRG